MQSDLGGHDPLQEALAATSRALKVADERTMQNTALRQTLGECEKERNYYFKLCSERIDEIERLTAALKICGAPFDTGPTSVNEAARIIAEEFERRMNVAANTLNDETRPDPQPCHAEQQGTRCEQLNF